MLFLCWLQLAFCHLLLLAIATRLADPHALANDDTTFELSRDKLEIATMSVHTPDDETPLIEVTAADDLKMTEEKAE